MADPNIHVLIDSLSPAMLRSLGNWASHARPWELVCEGAAPDQKLKAQKEMREWGEKLIVALENRFEGDK